MRARIAKVNNDSLVRFSNFSEDFRQTNCGVPLRIGRPTMLNRHMTSFAEKTGFEVLLPRITFFGFGSSSKTYTVDCCFVSGSYAKIHAPVKFNQQEPFFERLSNCAGSNKNKLFFFFHTYFQYGKKYTNFGHRGVKFEK